MTPGHSASVTGGIALLARGEFQLMDKFGTMFPLKRQAFTLGWVGASRWVEAKYGEGVWWDREVVLLADDLLKRVLSWYEDANIFTNSTFSGKLSRYRKVLDTVTDNKKKDSKTAKRAAWKGFLDFRLDDDQLQELDEWQPSATEIFDQVDAILLVGFRLTLSYNPLTKLANCTVIDDRSDQASGGFALSTADSSCALALKAAVFKHWLVLQGDWSSLLDKPSQGGRRG